MTSKIDELGKKMHTKLDVGLDRLKTLKIHLEEAPKEAEDAINSKLIAAKAALKANKKECVDAKDRVKGFIEEKKVETKETVADWKAKLNTKKLEARAERAKKHAESRVEVALYAALEAEEAILEAVAAQKDVDGTM